MIRMLVENPLGCEDWASSCLALSRSNDGASGFFA